jgi:hypothetical protein
LLPLKVREVIDNNQVKLSLCGDNIRISCEGGITENDMQALKTNKRQIVTWMKAGKPKANSPPIEAQIRVMFAKAMYSLDGFYSDGSFSPTKHPTEFRAISQLEETVREVWLRCLDGEASLPEFREALKVWYLRVREYLKMEEKAQLEGLKNVR